MEISWGSHIQYNLKISMSRMYEFLGVKKGDVRKSIETPVCAFFELILESAADSLGSINLVNEQNFVLVNVGRSMSLSHFKINC